MVYENLAQAHKFTESGRGGFGEFAIHNDRSFGSHSAGKRAPFSPEPKYYARQEPRQSAIEKTDFFGGLSL